MAHELKLLTKKLYNTPHLIEAKSFEAVMSYLEHRNSTGLDSSEDDSREAKSSYYNPDTKVGIMSIDGPLTYKPVTMMGFDCGGTSYTGLMQEMDSLVAAGMKTLVLEADSGGGEAYMMFETAQYLRNKANEAGVKILSYVDGMAASACYGLISIADEIIVNPQAEVGSIGVVVRLMNDSKNLEMNGYERTFVYAGDSKIPYAEDGKFRKEFLADIQEKVDSLYEGFTEFVAEHRGISLESVRSTEAKTFLPKKALELGLADDVMTHQEFYKHLADTAQKENTMFKDKILNMKSSKPSEAEMQELENTKTQLSEAQVLLAAKDAKITELQAFVDSHADMRSALEEAQAKLAIFESEKQAAELAAKEAVAQARLAKLTAAVGTEKAAELSAKFEGADDALFEAMVGALEFASAGEKQSALFSEMGSDKKVETSPSMEQALAAELQKKYKTK